MMRRSGRLVKTRRRRRPARAKANGGRNGPLWGRTAKTGVYDCIVGAGFRTWCVPGRFLAGLVAPAGVDFGLHCG